MLEAMITFLGSLLGGVIISGIIVGMINIHIEKYCELIGVEIKDKTRPLNAFEFSHPTNENTEKLEKYITKLMYIYTSIFSILVYIIVFEVMS